MAHSTEKQTDRQNKQKTTYNGMLLSLHTWDTDVQQCCCYCTSVQTKLKKTRPTEKTGVKTYVYAK